VKYLKAPTDPIFFDAYAIADAIVRQDNQEKRLNLLVERKGIMANGVAALSNDIVRLSVLIRTRIEAWETNYGSTTNYKWHQHLPDHRNVDKVLEKVEQWAS
jgi:hypothetical protein